MYNPCIIKTLQDVKVLIVEVNPKYNILCEELNIINNHVSLVRMWTFIIIITQKGLNNLLTSWKQPRVSGRIL